VKINKKIETLISQILTDYEKFKICVNAEMVKTFDFATITSILVKLDKS